MELTKEQFDGWISHPHTKVIFKKIQDLKMDTMEYMASGGHVDVENALATAMRSAEFTGYIRGLDALLMIHYEEG